MQNYKLFTIMMMVMIVFILSCKKQSQTFEKNTGYSPTEMKLYHQLVSFNEKIRSDMKTQTFLEADSAIWYLEALFNVQNGYPDSCSESTMSVDLNYTLPLENGMVSMTQVSQTYSAMEADLDSLLGMIGAEVKFMIMADLSEVSRQNEILHLRLIPMIGINPYLIYEPFLNDDNWYYGEMYGRCDGLYVNQSDAGEELERRLNNSGIEHYGNVFREIECHTVFPEDYTANPTVYGPYRIYYNSTGSFPPCVPYDALNYYLVEAHLIMHYEEKPIGLEFGSVDVKSHTNSYSTPPFETSHYYIVLYGEWVNLPPIE